MYVSINALDLWVFVMHVCIACNVCDIMYVMHACMYVSNVCMYACMYVMHVCMYVCM